MGAFKGLEHGHPTEAGQEPLGLTDEVIAASSGLFESFDPQTHGGLRVTSDGHVFEIRHPSWADESATLSQRATALPISVTEEKGKHTFDWLAPPLEPGCPSLGTESELTTMDGYAWHDVSPDGANLVYPDGTTETFLAVHKLEGVELDPEALKIMIEYKSAIAHGYGELFKNMLRATYQTEVWLDLSGMKSPRLSVHPGRFSRRDLCELPYIRKKTSREQTPNMGEFGTMSDQLHVQSGDPEAAQHAINIYQGPQAIIGLLTAAGPIRDESFETTIGQHYRVGETVKPSGDPNELPLVTLPDHDYVAQFTDVVPYDWREPSRMLGSSNGGALLEPAPMSLEAVLRKADRVLRNGDNATGARVLSEHGERLRNDIGTIEVCNAGTAGGNLYKSYATKELVGKFLVAAQLHYSRMNAAERAAWKERYQAITETGHFNNIRAALFGKTMEVRDRQERVTTEPTTFIGMDGSPTTTTGLLQGLIDYANKHNPAHRVSTDAQLELFATLSSDPILHLTAKDTFDAYFKPRSRMTATDAMRHAHNVQPEIPYMELLDMFAEARRQHVYDLHSEVFDGEPQPHAHQSRLNHAGALALEAS